MRLVLVLLWYGVVPVQLHWNCVLTFTALVQLVMLLVQCLASVLQLLGAA